MTPVEAQHPERIFALFYHNHHGPRYQMTVLTPDRPDGAYALFDEINTQEGDSLYLDHELYVHGSQRLEQAIEKLFTDGYDMIGEREPTPANYQNTLGKFRLRLQQLGFTSINDNSIYRVDGWGL